jgi:C1A family cysteine protease
MKKVKYKTHALLILLIMMLLTIIGCSSGNDSETVFVPEKYDLRDYNLITPVKNQCGLREDGVSDVGTAVGLCWAFASLSSFESSLLKQGYQTDPTADEANLSPWYLGNYITYNAHPLDFNPTLWFIPVELVPATALGYNESLTAKGWGGGGGHWTCDYINGGNSVVFWKDSPMPNDRMTRHENLQKPAPLPSRGYMAKDMYLFEPDDYTTPEEFMVVIKKAVLQHGAIQSYVNLDAVDIDGIEKQIIKDETGEVIKVYNGHRFMDKANSNYYCYDESLAGSLVHAVSIAGWDNRRKIDIDGHKTTGAWLVKDSNGENSHDKGYYWVAFDDAVFLKSGSFATGFTAHPGTGYKPPYLYQTHSGALTEVENNFYWYQQFESDGYDNKAGSWACANFTAKDDEKLKAVGIVTMNRNEDVNVMVYKNTSFPPSTNSAALYAQSFHIKEKGYHMLDFKRLLNFTNGDSMTIVIQYKYRQGHEHPVVYVTDPSAPMPPTYWTSSSHWNWSAFPENSAFYIQAVMSDE